MKQTPALLRDINMESIFKHNRTHKWEVIS